MKKLLTTIDQRLVLLGFIVRKPMNKTTKTRIEITDRLSAKFEFKYKAFSVSIPGAQKR